MKLTSVNKILKQITHSELALYLLLGLAFFNLLSYLQYNYLGAIVIFLVVGLLTSHYTKNMVVVLGITILVTNLLVGIGFLKNLKFKEGFREGATASSTGADSDKEDKDSSDDEEDISNLKSKLSDDEKDISNLKSKLSDDEDKISKMKTDMSNLKSKEKTDMSNMKKKLSDDEKQIKKLVSKSKSDDSDDDSNEGFLVDYEDIELKNKNKKYAQAMGGAQLQMGKLLGKNGVQNLDTTELLKQQKDLMQAMKNMQPLIDGANNMFSKIGGSPIAKMLGMNKQ
jgi:septal ring factor EnvC (AmiA/AmiB activator)